ncbi:hypothetical protein V6N12_044353 [Hibiscus sabdariffa]|uniref:hAT-like transposase RNase-H fold domain-containing protein n=1 Tax=Hibiscus sabdariffa TaxID=183260 RepID=A0ABR2DH26_9ROSI
MFSYALKFKDIFPRYAQQYASYKHLPSDEDWLRVEKVCSFLALFNEVTNIISAILDPKNKMKLTDFSFRVMYSKDEAPRQIRMMCDSIYELYKEYVDEYAAANVNTTIESDFQESDVINTCTTSRIGKGKVLTKRSKFERYIKTVDIIDNVKSELDIYLGEGVFICKEECSDFDAL